MRVGTNRAVILLAIMRPGQLKTKGHSHSETSKWGNNEKREDKAGQVLNRTEQCICHYETKNDERSRKMGFLHVHLLHVSLHDACSLSSPITFRTGEPFATIFLVIFGHVAF